MSDTTVHPLLEDAACRVAPGTDLRESIDMIIAAKTGALICVGDVEAVDALSNGGFRINTPFTSQRLFELSKMDGAILLDEDVQHILSANLHLMPDPSLVSSETGTRHRTAELISRQTKTLVISISQRRDVVSLYLGGERLFIENTEALLSKANQALQTLQNYRTKFGESLDRLTLLELNDMVKFSNLTYVIDRYEMLHRVQLEIERYALYLGVAGRLVNMQLDEITSKVDKMITLLIRDYAVCDSEENAQKILENLSRVSLDELYDHEIIARELGYPADIDQEEPVSPRGYRVMSRIPMLSRPAIGRVIEEFGSLRAIAQASPAHLDSVSGITSKKARAILNALDRLKEASR